jgi:hypothetical protein
MELDARGVRIEHKEPLRTFLTNLPCTVPCEEPDACAFMKAEVECENRLFPSPPLPAKEGPVFPPPAPLSPSDVQLLPPPAEISAEKPATH